MSAFNFAITVCVVSVMLVGAAITYYQRTAEMDQLSLGDIVAQPKVKDAGYRAPLPRWDDKNYKGLVYRP